MAEIRDLILKTYLKKGVRPTGAPKIEEPGPAPAPIKTDPVRTVGMSVAMQAQRIFNPGMPPAPPTKPNKTMTEQGTGPAMDVDQSFLKK